MLNLNTAVLSIIFLQAFSGLCSYSAMSLSIGIKHRSSMLFRPFSHFSPLSPSYRIPKAFPTTKLFASTKSATSSTFKFSSKPFPIDFHIAPTQEKEFEDSLVKYTGPRLPLIRNDDPQRKDGSPSHTCVLSLSLVKRIIKHLAKTKERFPKPYVNAILDASRLQHEQIPEAILRLSIPKARKSKASSPTTTQDKTEKEKQGESPSFSIFGDTHGQFQDLAHILSDSVAGFPSKKNIFLFNGDFVDRGAYGVEVVLSLLMMKLACPSAVHLTRGNHETTQMNAHGGFGSETTMKYDSETLQNFRSVFSRLPIAAVLENKVFVVHGGIGKLTSKMTLDEIGALKPYLPIFEVMRSFDDDEILDKLKVKDLTEGEIDKEKIAPSIDMINELLWNDPGEDNQKKDFEFSERGFKDGVWGPRITQQFLNSTGTSLIVRSHQVMNEGIRIHHFGSVITIFSAPNYCGVVNNLGAFLRFKHAPEVEDVTTTAAQESQSEQTDAQNDKSGNENENAENDVSFVTTLSPNFKGLAVDVHQYKPHKVNKPPSIWR